MRKYCALVILLFFLSGCSSSSYEKGYEAGYREGFSDAEVMFDYDMDSIIDEQYYAGYMRGYNRIDDSFSDAEIYALDRSEFSPEEAMMVIDSYENGTPFWNDEDPASEEDYQNAVRTLYYFYQYYFNGEFSHYENP